MGINQPNPLALQVAKLTSELESLKRVVENFARNGEVTDVDPKKQLARISLGKGPDGKEQKSPWRPYGQIAGKLKVHWTPTKGQNLTMISIGGDFNQGFFMPLTWSDDFKSPSEEEAPVVEYGDVRLELSDDSITATIGGVTWTFSSAGFKQEGGAMGHDGKDIGKTHKHIEVMPGPSTTGIPTPGGP